MHQVSPRSFLTKLSQKPTTSQAGGMSRVARSDKPDTMGTSASDSALKSIVDSKARLNEMLNRAEDDAPKATDALIAFIQQRYSSSLVGDLNALLGLACRADLFPKDHIGYSRSALHILLPLRARITAQIQSERSFLFPMMLSGACPKIVHLLDQAILDHHSQLTLLRELLGLAECSQDKAIQLSAWRAFSFGVGEFADDLKACIHLKQSILYPRFYS